MVVVFNTDIIYFIKCCNSLQFWSACYLQAFLKHGEYMCDENSWFYVQGFL